MKASRLCLATLALALSGSAALGAPILKSDIIVAGPVVTVGDMFDDAGALAEKAIFRAPLPGTTGNVDLAAIRSASARIGLADFETNGLVQVRVSRDAAMVDQSLLADLITEDLRARGILTGDMQADILLARAFDPIRAEATDAPARLDSLRYRPGNGSFAARFLVDGLSHPLDIAGTIELSVAAPHLASSLPTGTVLRPDHFVMRQVPVQQADAQGFAPLDQLVGMSLNRQSREGMLVRASDVSVPLAIAKNDLVTIYYRQGPMTLTVRGQAVTGAAQGGSLQVLNLISRRVVSATAIAPGAVEVSAAPVTLAGL
ncbi:flagellar basal body P-ring formation chaperone FlgA [Devosia sp. YIM 151766]|uniref:flagellar basal body P-ring formation chaperone FlgA n=1 Tax=Devosia sp. YIM 151766 TaxID=3017325 RepID=UPI00255C9921|nr:flagellar basal body P-ring formation chaperone FlgA [Devosia sp. YIM 151766]WIY51640.1 flagellar basal body P-ring formation chaperone FlgA [Devosia sp. YIM 151766]